MQLQDSEMHSCLLLVRDPEKKEELVKKWGRLKALVEGEVREFPRTEEGRRELGGG